MEIIKPNETTYWIGTDDKDDTNIHYGEVTPEQELTTAKIDVWTTFDKEEWIAKLLTCGIEIKDLTINNDN